MAKRRRRSTRKHHRGMGSAISLRGLGKVKSSRGLMHFILPTAVGVLVPAATIAAARYWAQPSTGPTQAYIYKYAPWLGLGAGLVSAGALYMMSRGPAAPLAAGIAATGVALTSFVHDQIVVGDAREAFITSMARAGREVPGEGAAAPDTANNGTSGLGSYFTQRPNGALGAAVAQLSEMNGVVMSPTSGVGYAAYTGGETVNLGAVNSSAFGTPGFRP
jgi:hypothetical protein